MSEKFEIFYKQMLPFTGKVEYKKEILKKGSVHGENALPLPCDMIFEKDVEITLRDGVKIYTDIFRPVETDENEKVPAIVAWSPYGKDFHGNGVEGFKLSNLQKFESPDPAYWIPKGYAIINPDTRGVGGSDGEFCHWSRQMGRDGADTVEWLAAQSWCNGKVAFSGNSYLAISQWFIASEQPEHLAAIAPWEGFGDVFHDYLCPGGIPDVDMLDVCDKYIIKGLGKTKDIPRMLLNYPHMNDFWKDFIPEIEKINVPSYVVASYTNKVHSRGTLAAYERLKTSEKWLRVHNTHEWSDFYAHQDELCKFFDFYLKGKTDNGWLSTPKVRLSVLNPGGEDIVERVEESYPLARTKNETFYIDASRNKISADLPESDSTASYESDDGKSYVDFVYDFEKRTEILGNIKVILNVSAESADDMDLFVAAKKLDANGNELPIIVKGAPYGKGKPAKFEWGNGRCRVSSSISDYESNPLKKGEIRKVEITLCPMGMVFEKGQKLLLRVSGFDTAVPELPIQKPIPTINKGKHAIHSGKENPSCVVLPVIG